MILRCAEGLTNTQVAGQIQVRIATVDNWRQRFVDRRMDGLMDEARPGAPRRVSDADGERALAMTLESTPKDATHLEYEFAGQSIGLEPQYGRPHLAGLCLATASQRNISSSPKTRDLSIKSAILL